jgi:hypothetical protein
LGETPEIRAQPMYRGFPSVHPRPPVEQLSLNKAKALIVRETTYPHPQEQGILKSVCGPSTWLSGMFAMILDPSSSTPPSTPSAEDIRMARQGGYQLATLADRATGPLEIHVETASGKVTVTIPASIIPLLGTALFEANHRTNSIECSPDDPTGLDAAQAGQFLNMDPDEFGKLTDAGEIGHTRTENGVRVSLADVLKYKAMLHAKRQAALIELSELDQRWGLGY